MFTKVIRPHVFCLSFLITFNTETTELLRLIQLIYIYIYKTLECFQYLSHWFIYLTHYLTSLYQNFAWLMRCVSFLQNSKPDSLLKMEEEHKFEKTPLGHRDNRFSFTMSHKKLLGYVYHCVIKFYKLVCLTLSLWFMCRYCIYIIYLINFVIHCKCE